MELEKSIGGNKLLVKRHQIHLRLFKFRLVFLSFMGPVVFSHFLRIYLNTFMESMFTLSRVELHAKQLVGLTHATYNN